MHAARYTFAAPLVAARRVLDIACGTGYGMTMLAPGARAVVGVDVDLDAARTARSESGGRLVLVGDGARLPFPDATFGAVTSFETIEHLTQRSEFLSELRRVLRPDGVCVISTPNANHTQPVDGKPKNPFHVHEYTPDEFGGALRGVFGAVDMLGQRLHPRFLISPFWDDQQRLDRTPAVQTRLLIWRVLNHLPHAIGDRASRAVLGQPLIPSELDYCFDRVDLSVAPVLVAVCRPAA